MAFYEDKNFMDIFNLVVSSAVTILALFGNTFTIIIFMSKNFRKQSMNRWFAVLAVSDTISIMIIWPMNNPGTIFVYTSVMCKMIIYIMVYFFQLSAFLIVLASIDRYLAILHSTKFTFRNKLWFQIVILIVTCSIVLAFNSPFVIFYDVNSYNGTLYCQFKDPSVILTLNITSAFLSLVLPSIIMIATSIGIIKKVNSSKMKFSKVNSSRKDNNLTKTLIGSHIFFIVFNSPVNIATIFTETNIAQGIDVALNIFIWSILMTLLLIHSSCSFFLYLISNKQFRKKFFMMVGLVRDNKAKITQTKEELLRK